jgi:hypothetical protein
MDRSQIIGTKADTPSSVPFLECILELVVLDDRLVHGHMDAGLTLTHARVDHLADDSLNRYGPQHYSILHSGTVEHYDKFPWAASEYASYLRDDAAFETHVAARYGLRGYEKPVPPGLRY